MGEGSSGARKGEVLGVGRGKKGGYFELQTDGQSGDGGGVMGFVTLELEKGGTHRINLGIASIQNHQRAGREQVVQKARQHLSRERKKTMGEEKE